MVIQRPTTIDALNALLAGARYLQSAEFKAYAIECIPDFVYSDHGPEIVAICFEYQTRKGFRKAFRDLLEIPFEKVSAAIINAIPTVILRRIVIIREQLQTHTARVALEEPLIENHASTCHDHGGCASDWHAAWWNIVGSGLLNGINPLAYTEALRRLHGIADIGRMDRTCFNNAVNVAQTAIGWGHRYELMETAAVEAELTIMEDRDFI